MKDSGKVDKPTLTTNSISGKQDKPTLTTDSVIFRSLLENKERNITESVASVGLS